MKIAVLSDIHGNQYALKEVLKEVKREKIEKLFILGDLVGYYYQANIVMNEIDSWDYELIKGNHEIILEQLLKGDLNLESIKAKYGSGHKKAIEKLSKQQICRLITAPQEKTISIEGVKFLLCHGTNWDYDYYLYPDANDDILNKCNVIGVDYVLVGHSHYQFVRRNKNSTLINVGSVGQSRNRGGIANWAIINTYNNCFELKSTPYDIKMLLNEIELNDPECKYLKEVLIRNNNE